MFKGMGRKIPSFSEKSHKATFTKGHVGWEVSTSETSLLETLRTVRVGIF
jgi:hypothetical protein